MEGRKGKRERWREGYTEKERKNGYLGTLLIPYHAYIVIATLALRHA